MTRKLYLLLRSTSLSTWIGMMLFVLGIVGLFDGPIPYITTEISLFHQKVAPELFGIGLVVILIEWPNSRRDQRSLRKQLVLQMRSGDPVIVKEAVGILRDKGWLSDSSLWSSDFRNTRLSGVNLAASNLRNSSFAQADLPASKFFLARLSGSNFWAAELPGALLERADLKNTNFTEANLQSANLKSASLQGANFTKANLKGANFSEAFLDGAILDNAQFDETTILPDRYTWSDETNMKRFTDPDHPNPWKWSDPYTRKT